jgi:hypothetical protein
MQMAVSAAAESDRRYEVIIDLTEQSYLLRQITSPDLSEVLDEEIIAESKGGVGISCHNVAPICGLLDGIGSIITAQQTSYYRYHFE